MAEARREKGSLGWISLVEPGARDLDVISLSFYLWFKRSGWL